MKKTIRNVILILVSITSLFVILAVAGYLPGISTADMANLPENTESTPPTQAESFSDADDLVIKPLVADPLPQMEEEPEPVFEPLVIHLMAVGDNLLHMPIVRNGKQADGSYNYDFEFEDIAPFLDASDIAIINQETPLAGNQRGFSGFPQFNSPTEVGDAIVKAGFNVVLGATNHAFDQGAEGLISFADYFENNYPEILMCGIHGSNTESDESKNALEQGRIKLLEIKGYTFAFLNYTYGPNLGSYPGSIEGHLDLLCAHDPKSHAIDFTSIEPTVLEDIQLADSLADIVVVCPHWGTEYSPTPSKYQIDWARQMTDAGADLIIGTHPHVVQPVETITTEAGNTSLCYYSLGNYVSTQKVRRSMLEAMAWVTFRDDGDGLYLDWNETGALGMIDQYTAGPLSFKHIYFLEDYTDDLAARHGITSWGEGRLNVNDLNTWAEELFGDMRLTQDDLGIFAPIELP